MFVLVKWHQQEMLVAQQVYIHSWESPACFAPPVHALRCLPMCRKRLLTQMSRCHYRAAVCVCVCVCRSPLWSCTWVFNPQFDQSQIIYSEQRLESCQNSHTPCLSPSAFYPPPTFIFSLESFFSTYNIFSYFSSCSLLEWISDEHYKPTILIRKEISKRNN